MRNQNRTIDLPDLGGKNEIVSDNVRAIQVIYTAAMLEDLKLFQVVDRLAQLFQHGLLPLNRRGAASGLYKYWKETSARMTETDRRNLYASTLGLAGGVDGVAVNREFIDLWMRFVARVAVLGRQPVIPETDELALRRSATELARNLSLHGGGVALFAAVDLQKQIAFSIKLLSEPEIKSAYGARDMWQVVDQVATIDLGGPVNINRHRVMSAAGATIISWLAGNARKLQSKSIRVPLLKIKKAQSGRVAANDQLGRTQKPGDNDLLIACEQWLSVNGVSDEQIDSHAQPRGSKAPLMGGGK